MRRILVTVMMALACLCTGPTQHAGGSSDSGNPRVVAVVVSPDGTPVAGAVVRLRRSDYLSPLPSLARSRAIIGADALTDGNGRFAITGIDPGAYLIEVNDRTAAAAVIACTLRVRDSVDLGTDTIRPFAVMDGAVDTAGVAGARRFVQIFGLERVAQVDANGRFSISDLPAGTYALRSIAADSAVRPPERFDGISAVAGDTTRVSTILPPPWQALSVGSESPAGSAALVNGRFVVSGGGPDIWQTSDGFHFVYQQHVGDGEIVALVRSRTSPDSCAKAGVMIRDSLDPSSPNALLSVEAGSPVHPLGWIMFSGRTGRGDTSSIFNYVDLDAIGPPVFPVWLRMRRSGDTLQADYSRDGATWSNVGDRVMTLPALTYAGLAVTSRNTALLCTAVVDSVSVK